MTTAAVRVHEWRGLAAVTLFAGELDATFLPELNMLGTSLRLGGEEFLALPGGVAAYRRGHATGLPILAPWANRLDGDAYRAGRRRVELGALDLHRDGNGLPIHGTLSGREEWTLRSLVARGPVARLHAALDYDRPELLAAFPFPHRLEVAVALDGRALSVVTSVTARTGAVPISFGYHPYLRLPRAPRSRWRLHLPRRSHLELDERGIPTGHRSAAPAETEPIAARAFDDLFELTSGRVLALEGGGRRIAVEYGVGYRFAQVFAPPGKSFVCLEPMTAPTNALRSGDHASARPGETFTARFRIRPERL